MRRRRPDEVAAARALQTCAARTSVKCWGEVGERHGALSLSDPSVCATGVTGHWSPQHTEALDATAAGAGPGADERPHPWPRSGFRHEGRLHIASVAGGIDQPRAAIEGCRSKEWHSEISDTDEGRRPSGRKGATAVKTTGKSDRFRTISMLSDGPVFGRKVPPDERCCEPAFLDAMQFDARSWRRWHAIAHTLTPGSPVGLRFARLESPRGYA